MSILLQTAALLVAVASTLATELPCDYEYNGIRLTCKDKGMTAPPAGLWPNVTQLYLDRNPITIFAGNAFSGFPKLNYLSSAYTSLTEIDLGDFVDLPNLGTLYVIYNNIKTVIPAPKGTTLQSLHTIFISGNDITTLDPDFLFNAPKMNRLRILDNPITVEPGQPIFNHNSEMELMFGGGTNFADFDIAALLAGVPNLTSLNINKSHLNNVTGAFVNHKKLKRVELGNNDITHITRNTFASEGVINYLSLANNPLQRLDTAAVNNAMGQEGTIWIVGTPLVRNCEYEGLYWWAYSRDIAIKTNYQNKEDCDFASRRSPASPGQNQGL